MVITDNKNDDAAAQGAYIDTTTATTTPNKSSSPSKNAATDIVAQKFKTFVESSFSATSKEEVEAAIDEVFSPSLVIVAGGEERDLDFFKRTVVAASKAPLTSRINFSEHLNDAQIRANWSLYVAGIKLFTVDRLLTIDVGGGGGDDASCDSSHNDDVNVAKIVRFEPFEGKTDLYTKIKQFFGLTSKDDIDIHVLAEKYGAFVESTANGISPSDLEAMIDDIFAPSFVVATGDKERDLAVFKQACLRTASSGFSAKVDEVSIVDSNHIRISYDLFINGEIKEELKCHRLLTTEDGKIVRMESHSAEDKGVYARIQKRLLEE